MLYAVMAFFLLTVPLIVNMGWGDGIRAPKEFLGVLGLVSICAVGLYNHTLKPFKNKWLLFFWIWCFADTALNSYLIPLYFEKGVVSFPAVIFAWKELFYISLAILTIHVIGSSDNLTNKSFSIPFFNITPKNDNIFHGIARIVSFLVILLSMYSLWQAVGLDEFFRSADPGTGWVAQHPLNGVAEHTGVISRRVVATLGNPAIFAIWIAMCLPLCLFLKNKLGTLAFTLGISTLLITRSSTAVIGAGTALLIYTFFKNKKLAGELLILFFLIGSILFVTPQTNHFIKHFYNPKGRIEVHKEAFKLIDQKAITGFGLGTFEYLIGGNPEIVQRLHNESWRELHDEYGQIWFTTGIVGLILFMGFIVTTIKSFLKNVTEEGIFLMASMCAFLVMSVSYFTMRIAPISFYGVIFTGLLYRTIGDKK